MPRQRLQSSGRVVSDVTSGQRFTGSDAVNQVGAGRGGSEVLTAWRKIDGYCGSLARLSISYAGGMVLTSWGSTGKRTRHGSRALSVNGGVLLRGLSLPLM